MKILAAFLFSLLIFSGINAQERYVKFVDEADKDASFRSFRTQFIATVKRRDVNALMNSLDPNIKVSFGGDEGIVDFKKFWKINSPDTKLWEELLKVLSGGGFLHRNGGRISFSAPYSFDGFPEDLDAFSYLVIFGNAVALRDKPSLDGRVITRLSYNIVSVDFDRSVTSDNPNYSTLIWGAVTTIGGQKGYVSAQYLRSPIDYRALFEKRRGKWKMTAFVAGD